MRKKAFIVRPMERGDIAGGVRLSNAEGWNQTGKDWSLLIENPQNVCMVAECGNKIIGTTTAINYANYIAWIGMVLVDKEHRGQGVSKTLLTNIFQRLELCKSIKLDATPEGQQVYKKFDFKDEYIIVRMVNTSLKNFLPGDGNDLLPVPIELERISEIVALDEIIFGANRARLIEALVKEYKGWLLKRNDRVTGFATGRDGNKYHQIGPVFASNTAEARILISKALENLINQPVVVDILHDKEDLLSWLSSIGFIKQRHFIRMYKKENPFPGLIDKQYLICGPEFG